MLRYRTALALLLSVVILLYRGSELWAKILTMGFAHMLAYCAVPWPRRYSRAFSQANCLLALASDVAIMFIIYSVLVFSYKYFLERRFFKSICSLCLNRLNALALCAFEISVRMVPVLMTGVISGAAWFSYGFKVVGQHAYRYFEQRLRCCAV